MKGILNPSTNAKKRVGVSFPDQRLEMGQANNTNAQANVGNHYNGVYYDQYGNVVQQSYTHTGYVEPSPAYAYHGWTWSARNLCGGLLRFLGVVMLVLGVIGFAIALVNGGNITNLENSVASLAMTQQSQQATVDKLVVPFDHTAPGPLQVGTEKQYVNIPAVAAMTLPSDLSAYLDNFICLFSKTAFAHTLTAGVGATFDGVNNIATFGGANGDGFCFQVISATRAVVRSNNNVAFSS